jgi:hypothetical protein
MNCIAIEEHSARKEMNDELVNMHKKVVTAYVKLYPGICLKALRNST